MDSFTYKHLFIEQIIMYEPDLQIKIFMTFTIGHIYQLENIHPVNILIFTYSYTAHRVRLSRDHVMAAPQTTGE